MTPAPSVTVVPGTQSARAQQLANAQFGPTQLVPIVLEGPKAQLDRQGPALVRALDKRPNTRVLSAWDGGAATTELRKSATAAMLVVSVDRAEADAVRYDEPQIESVAARTVKAPVKSYVTGQPVDRPRDQQRLARQLEAHRADRGWDPVRAAADRAARPRRGRARDHGRGAQHVCRIRGSRRSWSSDHPQLSSRGAWFRDRCGARGRFALLIIDRFRREEHAHHMDGRQHRPRSGLSLS
jgi:hypothetical protein